MSDEELERLERLANAAPPGKWFYAGTSELHGQGLHILDSRATGYIGEFQTRETADFCAAAHPGTVKALCAEVRRLRDIVDKACCPGCGEPWAVGERPIVHKNDCKYYGPPDPASPSSKPARPNG